MKLFSCLTAYLLALFVTTESFAADMRLAVTTSFHNSGLADVLLPEIKKDLGIDVHLLVVGTGQALKLGRAGDVDALLVHSKAAEEEFVAEDYGSHRLDIMYNDFVLIGPVADTANIARAAVANDAFKAIALDRAIFVSRGDDSGTHRKEMALWETTGLNPQAFDATWYRATGSGMGATLNAASAMDAYVFADRASWLNFGNKGDLKILFAGDPALFNQYGYIPVNPVRHPHVKADLALRLENWLVSAPAQKLIAAYQINGEQLFTPNGKPRAHTQ
ncbi:MAG: sulfate ABC transporter substrate-binding protein [Sneathiella sp.]|nr:MAG: sulfate ABC transporter substrate-binding protein [Sneathiella sp.]